MATSPCEPIDPAVTHTLSWQVGNFAITSENRQIGFRESPSGVETIKKFTEFLESNQVTPLSAVLADGVLRPAQWSSKPPEIQNFKYAEYQLWSSRGIIYIYTPTPTGTERESILFFNTEKTSYYGASSEGNVIIYPAIPKGGYGTYVFYFVANSIPAYIFRAINKINAKLASAYPQATRVLAAPPAPLFEDEINISSTIGCNANFKLYIEYKGPDGEFITTISPPGWRTWAGGTTIAETDWSLENNPPLNDANHMLQYWGGSEAFIDFFFRRELAYPPQEGKYGLLIQPIWIGDREDAGSNTPIASGGMSASWGKDIDGNTLNEVAKFWVGGEFNAFTKFTRFDSKETYLFTHQWEVKHLHLVATKIEIKTTPPVIPKITNLDCQIVITDPAIPTYVGAYAIRINYTKQYAVENTRDHTTVSDPAPTYQTVDCTIDIPWGNYIFGYPPNPLPSSFGLNVDGHLIYIDPRTNIVYTKWGTGYRKENCFVYSIKIYYESVGKYLPDDLEKTGSFTPSSMIITNVIGSYISRLGFYEEPLPNWPGSAEEDKPDAIPENISIYYDTGKQISIKLSATYEEGSIKQDNEKIYGESETTVLQIDYSEIGGPPFFWGERIRPSWPSLSEAEY